MNKVFQGEFVNVGVEGGVEKVFIQGSVHNFLITDEKKIRLTIEKRFDSEEVREKLQSGIIEEGELPLDTAKRELCEEIGLVAEEWQEFIVQKFTGTINDIRYYYIAKKLSSVSDKFDREVIGTNDYSLESLYEKAMQGEFSPMTQAAIARLYFDVSKGKISL